MYKAAGYSICSGFISESGHSARDGSQFYYSGGYEQYIIGLVSEKNNRDVKQQIQICYFIF